MNADAEVFAGVDAGGCFIGGCAAAAASTAAAGAEGCEIEAEEFGERGLEVVDFVVEFEEEAGFGLWGEIGCRGDAGAEAEGLFVDTGDLMG